MNDNDNYARVSPWQWVGCITLAIVAIAWLVVPLFFVRVM